MPGDGGALNGTSKTMTGPLIGCAHVSTNDQNLTARKYALVALGVASEKTFTGQGLARGDRARPALKEALAAWPSPSRTKSCTYLAAAP